nr:PREDICTED: uncharacterized protein KIAA1522 homolog isoform X2 [Lepisosteus oculatus]
MGNTLHKKKAPHAKPKSFWHFGRAEKLKPAAPKPEDDGKLTVHFKASALFQENVFIEGSRPQYLEDLHSEAQEGLKSLQLEENEKENGLHHRDDQSISSSMTLQPESEAVYRNRKGSLESTSTTADTVSAVSTRSALVRAGSTFKPCNNPKKPEKTKKRSRRTTIMGIPQHVQKELGIDRGSRIHHSVDGPVSFQLANGGDGSVVIPTIDGEVHAANHEGARVHLQAIEASEEKLLKRHIMAVYKDDLALNQKVGPRFSPIQRPKSLAVPGMTTHSVMHEPPSPVMSMSPQATYMSKIIPNAILPALVDVIEINRSRSRSSVRTVSKSSLVTASPASTRSSMRSSARNFNTHDLSSNSSNWSHSQSSETIVSNSSTISSKGSAKKSRAQNGTEECLPKKEKCDRMSVNSSVSWASASCSLAAKHSGGSTSPAPSTSSMVECSDTASIQSDRSFNRNLSVMKMKRPPAPPRRTYSLHQDKLKLEHQVDEVFSPGSPSSAHSGSPAYSADCSSPDDSRSPEAASPLAEDQRAGRIAVLKESPGSNDSSPQKLHSLGSKFERTLSPSSGYSSQSGTPTLSTKEIAVSPSSPGRQKTRPAKPERTGSRLSPGISVSSSLTSLSSATSEAVHQETSTNAQLVQPKPSSPVVSESAEAIASPAVVKLKEMFEIPPPPKVKAPSPPPPETWVNKMRTFEILYGHSVITNRFATKQKQQQQESPREVCSVEEPGSPTQAKNETQAVEKTELSSAQQECPGQSKMESPPLQKLESPSQSKKELPAAPKQESPPAQKKEPPPVMKKSSPAVHKKESVPLVQKSPLLQNKEISQEEKKQNLPLEKTMTPTPVAQYLAAPAPAKVGPSPPPSPPPAHHPPPPPAKKTPTSSVSSLPPEPLLETPGPESTWPPPPPPLDEPVAVVVTQDELDFSFPPPPPPVSQEAFPEIGSSPAMPESSNHLLASETITGSVTVQPEETNTVTTTAVIEAAPTDSKEESAMLLRSVSELQKAEVIPQAPTLSLAKIKPSEPPQTVSPPAASASDQSSSKVQVQPSQENPPGAACTPLASSTIAPAPPPTAPPAPLLALEKQAPGNFRKQPSLSSHESKNKELLSRSKSMPPPKEDASIPLVTPSLLQMVRLRSVNVGGDQAKAPEEETKSSDGNGSSQDQSQSQNQSVPQKPIRKSLSLKSPPASAPSPSMRLQEAIRMKTAAMSSKDGYQARLGLRSSSSSTASNEPGASSPRSPEEGALHKSPASTASFIFSKSTKKVVIETPSSPEAQTDLKKNLVAELMSVSSPTKTATSPPPFSGKPATQKKPGKVPPPVARKPSHVSNNPVKPASPTTKTENSLSEQQTLSTAEGELKGPDTHEQIESVQPAGQQALPKEKTESASNPETGNPVTSSTS